MKNKIYNDIKKILGKKPSFVVFHSSLANLGYDYNINKNEIYNCFKNLINDGWSFAFPSFTFSFCKNKYFSPIKSKSETGILADLILENFHNAYRSICPIYSFVIIGDKKKFKKYSKTTFGVNSIFEYFEKINAKILMAGVDWNYCTQFHRYEELSEVPYRYYKNFKGKLQIDTKIENIEKQMYVRKKKFEHTNDFSELINALKKEKKIISHQPIVSKFQICNVNDIKTIAMKQLSINKNIYLKKSNSKTKNFISNKTFQFKVAILGSTNIDIISNLLENYLNQNAQDLELSIYKPNYGQYPQEIHNHKSKLINFNANLTIFPDRIEDLLGKNILEFSDLKKIKKVVSSYIKVICKYVELNSNNILVHRFSLSSNLTLNFDNELLNLIDQSNLLLTKKFKNNQNIFFLDPSNEYRNTLNTIDSRIWYIGKIPYSNNVSENLVKKWSKSILALTGKNIRLIVLDLDNTIWGGVLGEDGIEGIKIGGDYPGNCYKDFQRLLKSLHQSGIGIAVCSKNDEQHVKEVFLKNREMILSLDDIISIKANWREKYINLQEISKELSMGLQSILFIDDNPIEREKIKNNLPEVRVLDMPIDPALYCESLANSIWLEKLNISKTDINRNKTYKSKLVINEKIKKSQNIDTYLSSLKINLYLNKLSKENIYRAVELCNKTNQFNTTTKRYSADNLKKIDKTANVILIEYEDKFVEKEIIGLIVLINKNTSSSRYVIIDLFLLSCRFLGRGIEKGIIEWLVCKAKEHKQDQIVGIINKTSKNIPIYDLYKDNGFYLSKTENHWVRKDLNFKTPKFLKIIDLITNKQSNKDTNDKKIEIHKTLKYKLKKILKIKGNFDFENSGIDKTPEWDSLKQIEIVLDLESHYQFKFDSKDIDKITNFKGLLLAIEKKLDEKK